MSRKPRKYENEYKVESVKLAREIGVRQASEELGIPYGTLHGWMKLSKDGKLDTGKGSQTPETGMTQAARIKQLEAELKSQSKEIKRLNELNEFLEEASAFFAASRRK